MIIRKASTVLVITMVLITLLIGLGNEAVFAQSKKLKSPQKIRYVVQYTHSDHGLRFAKTNLKWKNVVGADGYQICIKYKDLGFDWTKWNSYKRKLNKIGMGEISSNCAYSMKVKVRAYKIRNGKKQYSKWSKVRYIDTVIPCRQVITDGENKVVY